METEFNKICEEYGLKADWCLMDELVFVSGVGEFYAVFTKKEIEVDINRIESYLVEMSIKVFV